jgi:hypothetical protein
MFNPECSLCLQTDPKWKWKAVFVCNIKGAIPNTNTNIKILFKVQFSKKKTFLLNALTKIDQNQT